ncbi:kynurenine 3-monooxygenase, mitochondrial precursor, partial [Cladochytrium tenue]
MFRRLRSSRGSSSSSSPSSASSSGVDATTAPSSPAASSPLIPPGRTRSAAAPAASTAAATSASPASGPSPSLPAHFSLSTTAPGTPDAAALAPPPVLPPNRAAVAPQQLPVKNPGPVPRTTTTATSQPPQPLVAAPKPFTVAIVGAGLVGSLSALYFARRGWHVNIYDSRQDPRLDAPSTSAPTGGRSINLALSFRGISALRDVGAHQGILDSVIPLKGRMLHLDNGALASHPYGQHGECINSVDRGFMNAHLLNDLDRHPRVTTHFEHDLVAADLASNRLTFRRRSAGVPGSDVVATSDLVVGADGAHSRLRQSLMRVERVDFEQHYIDHGYVELHMPPDETTGGYRMDQHHLHIWPKHSYMLIALPNPDNTFTLTLFMPWSRFEAIKTEDDLLALFRSSFPDALRLIGQERLVADYFANPKGSLISIKCNRYHHSSRAVLLGDAAHAMVPFFGQGMNCGLEDCLVLDAALSKHLGAPSAGPAADRPDPDALARALAEFSETRVPDAHAICDLAM